MAQQHNLKKIRTLLNEGFSDEELRQLIFDVPVFRPVFNQLVQNTSKAQIVQQLLEYADQKELIKILLDQVKERNPAKYEKYQPYYDMSANPIIPKDVQGITATPATISGSVHERPQTVQFPLEETGHVSIHTLSEQKLAPLKEALARRSLALFIGADLPREITGLPSRADLARDLARRYGLDESLPLAEVAQRVSRAGNRWEFTDFLRHELDTIGRSPQPFHEQVAALVRTHQPEILITTTYDNLLEVALQQAGVAFNRIVRSSQLNFLHPNRPTLIKLYGDALEPDTLVVTDQDHTNLLRNQDKAELVGEVKRAFQRNTMLFLGYNLTDPDFRFLFDQIAENRFARIAYAVWPGLPEVDVRMWADRSIIILEVDPLSALV